MATRSVVLVKKEDGKKIQIYRHWDGYPDAVLPDLQKIYPFAWALPRFEADEFSAAIVSAWKGGEGNIRIYPEVEGYEGLPWDVEYIYEIDELGVTVFSGNDGKNEIGRFTHEEIKTGGLSCEE